MLILKKKLERRSLTGKQVERKKKERKKVVHNNEKDKAFSSITIKKRKEEESEAYLYAVYVCESLEEAFRLHDSLRSP